MYNSSGDLITLPVELIDFKGTPSVSGNVLTWITASEVNNRGFQVERLVSDKIWETLSFVKSKGAYGTYSFTDKNPLSTSYYRLKQVDHDETFEYSKVISITQTGKGKGLKIYPNPVANTLTVEFDSPLWELGAGDFQILNLLGQQVLTGKIAAQGLDVSALPQGTYVLKVGTEQAKFIKQ
jgi:Secretion system C-terminal sorting domain